MATKPKTTRKTTRSGSRAKPAARSAAKTTGRKSTAKPTTKRAVKVATVSDLREQMRPLPDLFGSEKYEDLEEGRRIASRLYVTFERRMREANGGELRRGARKAK